MLWDGAFSERNSLKALREGSPSYVVGLSIFYWLIALRLLIRSMLCLFYFFATILARMVDVMGD
jgi:hypothetical protein